MREDATTLLSSTIPTTMADPSDHQAHCGHSSRNLSNATLSDEKSIETGDTGGATGVALSRTISRRETALSRIRTRPPIGNFTHPLAGTKTTSDFLVDFDGPHDPYRPMNWQMKKKVVTTMLYGLTVIPINFVGAKLKLTDGKDMFGVLLDFGLLTRHSTDLARIPYIGRSCQSRFGASLVWYGFGPPTLGAAQVG